MMVFKERALEVLGSLRGQVGDLHDEGFQLGVKCAIGAIEGLDAGNVALGAQEAREDSHVDLALAFSSRVKDFLATRTSAAKEAARVAMEAFLSVIDEDDPRRKAVDSLWALVERPPMSELEVLREALAQISEALPGVAFGGDAVAFARDLRRAVEDASSLRAQLDRLVSEIGTSCDGETALQRARRLRELEGEVRALTGNQNAAGLRLVIERLKADIQETREELSRALVERGEWARRWEKLGDVQIAAQGLLEGHAMPGQLVGRIKDVISAKESAFRQIDWVRAALGLEELPEGESEARLAIEGAIQRIRVEALGISFEPNAMCACGRDRVLGPETGKCAKCWIAHVRPEGYYSAETETGREGTCGVCGARGRGRPVDVADDVAWVCLDAEACQERAIEVRRG